MFKRKDGKRDMPLKEEGAEMFPPEVCVTLYWEEARCTRIHESLTGEGREGQCGNQARKNN